MNTSSIFKLLAIIAVALSALLAGLMFRNTPPTSTTPNAQPSQALTRLMTLKFPDSQGQETAMAAWQGKTLVVNFWATWCPPCREEMPAFSRLQEARRADGVQFIGIAVDSAENVKDFAAKHPVSYPLLVGGTEIIELARDLGNLSQGLPFTLILDQNGRLYASKLGGINETELAAQLDRLRSP